MRLTELATLDKTVNSIRDRPLKKHATVPERQHNVICLAGEIRIWQRNNAIMRGRDDSNFVFFRFG